MRSFATPRRRALREQARPRVDGPSPCESQPARDLPVLGRRCARETPQGRGLVHDGAAARGPPVARARWSPHRLTGASPERPGGPPEEHQEHVLAFHPESREDTLLSGRIHEDRHPAIEEVEAVGPTTRPERRGPGRGRRRRRDEREHPARQRGRRLTYTDRHWITSAPLGRGSSLLPERGVQAGRPDGPLLEPGRSSRFPEGERLRSQH
jgi:hypothetical protein